MQRFEYTVTGADPELLERGLRCVKEGARLCLIFLKYPMKMK